MKWLILTIYLTLTIISSNLIIKDYYHPQDTKLKVAVGSMNSIETQIPFSYYYLNISTPNPLMQYDDNIAEIFTGDYTYLTNYEIVIKDDQYCKYLDTKSFSNSETYLFKWMIDRDYRINFYLDKLPAGLNFTITHDVHYYAGIPIGFKEYNIDGTFTYVLYNHYTFNVHVNKNNNKYTIVGFYILPLSIRHGAKNETKCALDRDTYNANFRNHERQILYTTENEETYNVQFTYDVLFRESNIPFSSRWDHYLHLENDKIHWFSLINSGLIILIFSLIVLYIFCRALKKDIEIYNTRVTGEDFIDEFGWKQVSNDVFRRPNRSMLLSTLVGTGIQLCSMVLYTLIFATLGFLSPEHRGNLLVLMIFLFIFMGVFAGYYSARFYKMFGGREWLKNALLTTFLYPSFAFSIFFLINFVLKMEQSSAAMKSIDIFALLIFWICCSSPLVMLGAFIGMKKKKFKNPGKINTVPSIIPEKPWYLKTKNIIIISGIFPFAAIFIELVYIMASIWRHYFYYLFGFLLLILIILVITCSEISIVLTYVSLCRGDYNWWWKSYLISGSPAIYVLLYSVYYFLNLNLTRLSSIIVYFCTMSLLSSIVFLISGSMGFISTYVFLRKIYSMIKID